MTDFKLYLNSLTFNSMKIDLLCNILNISPEIQPIQLHKKEHKTTEFLSINPEGKVPVLVEGDTVLTESNAILQYLSNKYQSLLWPKDNLLQAQVLKWLFWQSNNWNTGVSPLSFRRVILPYWGVKNIPEISDEQLALFHNVMLALDNALANKNMLVGEQLSIADISIASYLMFASEADLPLQPYANVRRWLSSLYGTHWWKKTYHSLTEILANNMHMHAIKV